MNSSTEKVKIITLIDNRGKQQKYMLLQNILGKGKYGKVYKAVHIDNPDKVFAVKVIKLESQKIRDECLKQLQIVRHLPKSLNLVQIHSQHMQSSNNFYLFQQFCNGGNLYEQYIRRKGKPYTQSQVFNMFLQIVSGFLDLRKGKIFHEDIKPQNILIKNNLYKLTDFGISQLSNRIEVSQVRRGTLIYMPPQKLKASSYVPTSKSQIFSLGVTLFQFIFGYHPYLNKKPQNYIQYLKLIHEATIKPFQWLKNSLSFSSLSADKMIRVILKMIELNQAKRLSLQQLQDYIKNTQPFKSMVISEVDSVVKRKTEKPIKYEAINYSQVIVKSQNGMGQLLCVKSETKKQILMSNFDSLKACLKFFRDTSSFIQQGIAYSENSKIHQLIRIQTKSNIQMDKLSRIGEIKFISLLLIERMFHQLECSTNALIFQSETKTNEYEQLSLGIEQDKAFIQSEFLNMYMDLKIQNKKAVWISLKENKKQIVRILMQQVEQSLKAIDCIRTNFREDMLAFIFLKFFPCILSIIIQLLTCFEELNINQIHIILESQNYKNSILRMHEFSSIQSQKRPKLRQQFQKIIKGQQILQDDQSNSDQFEVLDISSI